MTSRAAACSGAGARDVRSGEAVLRKNIIVILLATVVMGATLAVGTAAPASAKVERYNPKKGATFNDPYGSKAEVRAVIRKINRTIDAVPRKGKIRIASWNVRSHNIGAALLRAHKRGVSVRVVMDRHNYNPNNPNIDAKRLHRGLKKHGNKKRPKSRRSWLKRCKGSCRGKSGIAHTKFFLFDKVRGKKNKKTGKNRLSKHVVIYGSYNATELGATIQWNDIFTIKNDKARYESFDKVFNQMKKDKARKQGYVGYTAKKMTTEFFPYSGKGTKKDHVMKMLDRVKCKGAKTQGGITRIRIAQTAMHGPRGLKLARKLADLQRQGCGIRVVYAMFGNRVLNILRNAGVPLTHLAWDSNGDGIYDRYLHSKAMTIVGNYGGNRKAFVTLNGSANWTGTALVSDEVVGVIRTRGVHYTYMKWIDKLFKSRPGFWNNALTTRMFAGTQVDHLEVEKEARANGVDPYALIKQEM